MCKQPSHCPGNVPSWGGPENVVQKFPRYQLCALLSPFPVKYRFRQEKNLQWTLRDVWQLKLSRASFCTAWFFFQLITTYQWTILISIYQISSFSSWIARNQLVILSELEAHSLCSLFSVVYSRKYETRMVGREIFLYPKQKKGCGGRDTHRGKSTWAWQVLQDAERSPGKQESLVKDGYRWEC